jgi:hypothetical protein
MTPRVFRKSLVIVSILFALTADISQADVSMTQHVTLGPSAGEWTRTLRIQGLRLRIDTERNGENIITIYDLISGKGYQLDPKRKEAIVVDLKSESVPKNGIAAKDLNHVFKKTGKKKEIGGTRCDEYSFDTPGPSAAPGHGMLFVQNDSGTVCVSQTIPEGIEVAHFVQEAVKRGYAVATGALSPTKPSIGFYFLGQEPNMVIVSATIQTRTKGPGVGSGTSANFTNTLTVSDIKPDLLPDELFQIPSDWKQKKESKF